jgi:hypothetical protein
MVGQSYLIKSPTLGILSIDDDGRRIPVTVPLNAIVKVQGGPLNGNRLVDVLWEGKTIMMFAQDIRSRGVEIRSGYPPIG